MPLQLGSEPDHGTPIGGLVALTASIAHEVNQPLAGIMINASTCLRMLAADPPNVDGALETVRRTIRDATRATDVIARMRALFSRQRAESELIDINEAAREVVARLSSELRANRVTVLQVFDGNLPAVSADRVQLQQVILNLLMNAVEAMKTLDDRERRLVVRTQAEQGGGVRLSVQDCGMGIPPGDLERIFDAFYTTKRAGMGIGLFVCRSIVESHGGRLWAASNASSPGATVSFSIP